MSTPEGHCHILLTDAKKRAKQSGVPFDIVIDDLLPIPEICPVFAIRLEYGTKGKYSPNSPSIDRVNPTKGYIKGNVWIISKRANTIKSDATPLELRQVADAIERRP